MLESVGVEAFVWEAMRAEISSYVSSCASKKVL